MEKTAFVLGILSIVTCSYCYLSIPMGAIAIILGLLSRGGNMKLSRKAKNAIIFAIIGILLTVILYAASMYMIINEYGSLQNYLRELYKQLGIDYDSLFENTLP